MQVYSITHAGEIVPDRVNSRGALLRRLIVFQIKLFVDGLRDLILSPISFVAAGLGIVFGGRNPHRLFDHLMDAGHGSDRWIDLFGHNARESDAPCLERMIGDIETALRDDHARAGMTAEAERRMRDLLSELRFRAGYSARQGF